MGQEIMLSGFGGMSGIVVLAVLAVLALAVWNMRNGKKKLEEQEKQEALLKEEKNYEKENADHERQIRLLASLRAQAENAEAEIVYSQLFGRVGEPVQKLFALAEWKEETEFYERMLSEEIQMPVREAIHMFQGIFTDTGLLIPLKRAEEESSLPSSLEKLSGRDITDAIGNCKERIESAKRYKIPKEAVSRSAVYLHKLTETPAAELDVSRLRDLADGIGQAFIQSGIYPMFQNNERLKERPDLCATFIEVQGGMPQLPGLFIEVGHRLQLYGNFQGTCRRRER